MNEELDSLVAKVFSRPRDSQTENRIIELLRDLDEGEALSYIQQMAVNEGIGPVEFARRALNKPEITKKYFEFGLERCNASDIQLLLNFAIHKLGVRRTMRILTDAQRNRPDLGPMALYWLPSMMEPEDRELLDALSSQKVSGVDCE